MAEGKKRKTCLSISEFFRPRSRSPKRPEKHPCKQQAPEVSKAPAPTSYHEQKSGRNLKSTPETCRPDSIFGIVIRVLIKNHDQKRLCIWYKNPIYPKEQT